MTGTSGIQFSNSCKGTDTLALYGYDGNGVPNIGPNKDAPFGYGRDGKALEELDPKAPYGYGADGQPIPGLGCYAPFGLGRDGVPLHEKDGNAPFGYHPADGLPVGTNDPTAPFGFGKDGNPLPFRDPNAPFGYNTAGGLNTSPEFVSFCGDPPPLNSSANLEEYNLKLVLCSAEMVAEECKSAIAKAASGDTRDGRGVQGGSGRVESGAAGKGHQHGQSGAEEPGTAAGRSGLVTGSGLQNEMLAGTGLGVAGGMWPGMMPAGETGNGIPVYGTGGRKPEPHADASDINGRSGVRHGDAREIGTQGGRMDATVDAPAAELRNFGTRPDDPSCGSFFFGTNVAGAQILMTYDGRNQDGCHSSGLGGMPLLGEGNCAELMKTAMESMLTRVMSCLGGVVRQSNVNDTATGRTTGPVSPVSNFTPARGTANAAVSAAHILPNDVSGASSASNQLPSTPLVPSTESSDSPTDVQHTVSELSTVENVTSVVHDSENPAKDAEDEARKGENPEKDGQNLGNDSEDPGNDAEGSLATEVIDSINYPDEGGANTGASGSQTALPLENSDLHLSRGAPSMHHINIERQPETGSGPTYPVFLQSIGETADMDGKGQIPSAGKALPVRRRCIPDELKQFVPGVCLRRPYGAAPSLPPQYGQGQYQDKVHHLLKRASGMIETTSKNTPPTSAAPEICKTGEITSGNVGKFINKVAPQFENVVKDNLDNDDQTTLQLLMTVGSLLDTIQDTGLTLTDPVQLCSDNTLADLIHVGEELLLGLQDHLKTLSTRSVDPSKDKFLLKITKEAEEALEIGSESLDVALGLLRDVVNICKEMSNNPEVMQKCVEQMFIARERNAEEMHQVSNKHTEQCATYESTSETGSKEDRGNSEHVGAAGVNEPSGRVDTDVMAAVFGDVDATQTESADAVGESQTDGPTGRATEAQTSRENRTGETQAGAEVLAGEAQAGAEVLAGEAQAGAEVLAGEAQTGGESRLGETQTGGENRLGETQTGGENRLGETQTGEKNRLGETQTGEKNRTDEAQASANVLTREAQASANVLPGEAQTIGNNRSDEVQASTNVLAREAQTANQGTAAGAQTLGRASQGGESSAQTRSNPMTQRGTATDEKNKMVAATSSRNLAYVRTSGLGFYTISFIVGMVLGYALARTLGLFGSDGRRPENQWFPNLLASPGRSAGGAGGSACLPRLHRKF